MGARYLTDLADVCRSTGWPVIEVDDWPRRARGSGGYDSGRPNHVIVHHTASGPASDGWPDVNYCCYGDEDAPIGNLYLARDGTVYVMAGGAANTNGTGQDPCGITPDDTMNSHSLAVEAGNSGTGEVWPDAQQSSYVALVAALCAAYGIGVDQVHAHFEWTSRKIDPAGPSRWATGSASWAMDGFRSDVGAGSSPSPGPPPDPYPPPTIGDDDMLIGALESNGTLWVGDGMRRRMIADPRDFDLLILVHGARFVNTSQQQIRGWGDVGTGDANTLNALGVA